MMAEIPRWLDYPRAEYKERNQKRNEEKEQREQSEQAKDNLNMNIMFFTSVLN